MLPYIYVRTFPHRRVREGIGGNAFQVVWTAIAITISWRAINLDIEHQDILKERRGSTSRWGRHRQCGMALRGQQTPEGPRGKDQVITIEWGERMQAVSKEKVEAEAYTGESPCPRCPNAIYLPSPHLSLSLCPFFHGVILGYTNPFTPNTLMGLASAKTECLDHQGQ